jgi:membrane protein YqaA with SNARE-associated domain
VLALVGLIFGVAFGSAVVPLISIEMFVLGMCARWPDMSFWIVGLAVAVGQVLGKLVYFYAARGDIHLPKFLHRRPSDKQGRLKRWFGPGTRMYRWGDWIHVKCRAHPNWMAGTHAVSSLVGVPPFMATSVLAGLAGMSTAMFVVTGMVGRFARFSFLAASPGMVMAWFGVS